MRKNESFKMCPFRNGHSKHNADNIIRAPDGQGCPRCSGFVYHADQVFSKGWSFN